jgi:hypothetical protein
MESICTAMPLKPGMWETIRKYRDELVNTLNHPDEVYGRQQRGLKTVKVFHQTQPIEALLLYFEGDDLKDAFHPRHREHESGAKMKEFWSRVAGMDERFLAVFPQLLIDWHYEEGHRQKAPVRAPKKA